MGRGGPPKMMKTSAVPERQVSVAEARQDCRRPMATCFSTERLHLNDFPRSVKLILQTKARRPGRVVLFERKRVSFGELRRGCFSIGSLVTETGAGLPTGGASPRPRTPVPDHYPTADPGVSVVRSCKHSRQLHPFEGDPLAGAFAGRLPLHFCCQPRHLRIPLRRSSLKAGRERGGVHRPIMGFRPGRNPGINRMSGVQLLEIDRAPDPT